MATEELVRLDIPALPAFVGVARSVVTTVATSVEGIDDDRLDDLRLAVSEACTNAVDGREAGDHRVVLRCVVDDEHRITTEGDTMRFHLLKRRVGA